MAISTNVYNIPQLLAAGNSPYISNGTGLLGGGRLGSGGWPLTPPPYGSMIMSDMYAGLSNKELVLKWLFKFGYVPAAIESVRAEDPKYMFIDAKYVIVNEQTGTLQLNEHTVPKLLENE
jgi:hypothetical protein